MGDIRKADWHFFRVRATIQIVVYITHAAVLMHTSTIFFNFHGALSRCVSAYKVVTQGHDKLANAHDDTRRDRPLYALVHTR